MVTALWAVLLIFYIALIQFFLLYYYEDSLMHVPVSHTINYNIQVLRNSKSSLLSTGGISYWERSACDFCIAPGEICGIFPTSCNVFMGEVPLLSTQMVTSFNGDNGSCSKRKAARKIQQKSLWSWALHLSVCSLLHDDEPVLASPVARVALTLSQVKGEEVDQWVDQQLQWLKLQDWQDPKVGSTFVEAFFKQFVPKGRWQNVTRIEMKWPYIDEYISNFEKAHIHRKQPLKGID